SANISALTQANVSLGFAAFILLDGLDLLVFYRRIPAVFPCLCPVAAFFVAVQRCRFVLAFSSGLSSSLDRCLFVSLPRLPFYMHSSSINFLCSFFALVFTLITKQHSCRRNGG
ncbi:hypothetical protein, partial [Geobacillus zalihae]|uniref:hypothetical protein n=1 Tax=Geobacillus zalihae TaxID=213419 RepID=UPI001A987388